MSFDSKSDNEQFKKSWGKPIIEALNKDQTHGGEVNNNPESEDATGIYS